MSGPAGDRPGRDAVWTPPGGWRSIAIATVVALVGAVAALVFAWVAGMDAGEMGNLAGMLAPSILVTGIAAALVTPLLAKASTRRRLVGVVLLASIVGLVNLAVLTQLMYVGGPDIDNVAIIFIYSTAAGAGVALAVSRGSVAAIERLEDTARRIADGDLEARTGPLEAEPEIQMLARTLDEMAARLAASVDRERELESQRRDMVAAMSHDLKTPLASLRAMVEAIDDGVVDDPETVARYHREMRGSVATLVEMIDDLFKLSRLDTEDLEQRSERVPLDQIVNAALAATSGQAAEKGVAIEVGLGDASAEACSPKLGRVIQNLIQNAVRHTPSGGMVEIRAALSGEAVELSVTDNGEGIPAEAVARVFDPFWRGDAARTSPGSGVGLTLAKRIVEALDGEITVESEPESGSRFAIVVPTG